VTNVFCVKNLRFIIFIWIDCEAAALCVGLQGVPVEHRGEQAARVPGPQSGCSRAPGLRLLQRYCRQEGGAWRWSTTEFFLLFSIVVDPNRIFSGSGFDSSVCFGSYIREFFFGFLTLILPS
jgi:hypothetical protein